MRSVLTQFAGVNGRPVQRPVSVRSWSGAHGQPGSSDRPSMGAAILTGLHTHAEGVRFLFESFG